VWPTVSDAPSPVLAAGMTAEAGVTPVGGGGGGGVGGGGISGLAYHHLGG